MSITRVKLFCKKLILNLEEDNLPNYVNLSSMHESTEYYKTKSMNNHLLKEPLITPKIESHSYFPNIQIWIGLKNA